MSVVSAIHASAAVLLVLAGAAKLSRPAPGWADLLGFRARTPVVRLVGASEAAAGVAALLRGLLQQALSDAGLDDRPGPSGRSSTRNSAKERQRRADEALLSAGIGPGHPSLYPEGSGPNGEHRSDSAEPGADR